MEPFKNLFNANTVSRISFAIKRSYSGFNQKKFVKGIEANLVHLEMKARVAHISDRLKAHLPENQSLSLAILLDSLKKSESDKIGLHQFELWPLAHYISLYGHDYFDLSMEVLKEITKLFTSEFAVRAFFIKNEKKTLAQFKKWMNDENEHVRRLASEGSRPLLPWGQKLQNFVDDPELTWPILEKLKSDSSQYVRKSVANHINDISKNHPELVIKKLLSWQKAKDFSPEINWIIKHASRTFIKKGFAKAFILHGVKPSNIKLVSQKILKNKIKLGEALIVEIILQNLGNKKTTVIIDHEVHFLRANNQHGIKVFKGKKMELVPGIKTKLQLKIPMKPVTTRKYYSGQQFWNIKINGKSKKLLPFNLLI